MKAISLVLLLWLMAAPHARAQTPEEKAYAALREQLVADLEVKRRAMPSVSEADWNRAEARAHDMLTEFPGLGRRVQKLVDALSID